MINGKFLETISGASALAIVGMIALLLYFTFFILHIHVGDLVRRGAKRSVRLTGRMIRDKEDKFSREYKIGIINKKKRQYKVYKFFDELTIDLGLKVQGVTPYELQFMLILASILISIAFSIILFNSLILSIFAFPIVTAAVICGCYTRANLAHDSRIEAIIEAENIICNNIKSGVRLAVQNSFDSLPKQIKNEFKDFLNNLDNMMNIKTALLELGNSLGSVSDDFIQKCIKFETAEEHGTAGIFQDIVEMNGIKSQRRIEMKRAFQQVGTEFIIGSGMILFFLTGVIIIFPVVRYFYFRNIIGQIIILADALIFIVEFVVLTSLRAQEL